MNRGEPPKRRTPVAAGKPLDRRTRLVAKPQPPKPRSALPRATQPINPVSDKRKVEQRERTKAIKADTGGERPVCQRCRMEPADDTHEVLSRGRGGSITDPTNFAYLGRACHTYVTEHPAEAEAEGWVLPSPVRQRVERAT